MEAKAIAKTLRVSPIKTRLVVDLIRGKDVNVALNILNNMNKFINDVLIIQLPHKKINSF